MPAIKTVCPTVNLDASGVDNNIPILSPPKPTSTAVPEGLIVDVWIPL